MKKIGRTTGKDKSPNYGFITNVCERFFYYLSMLPPWLILFSSTKSKEEFRNKSKEDQELTTKRKAIWVEIYIAVWLVVEVVMFATADRIIFPSIPIIAATLRIVDIIQSNLNIVVFDSIRLKKPRIISSAVRVLVLMFVNFTELIVCYSIIYRVLLTHLDKARYWYDGLFFSAGVQLSIGYGDLVPLIRAAKLIAMSQGIISLIFTALFLGTVITLLPRLQQVNGNQ